MIVPVKLAADLGYSHHPANPLHRLVRWSHLIATPYAGTLALLGTNFGQASTPAWVLNLEAEPRATVTYHGLTREVVARPATPGETDEVFALAGEFYPGYLNYRERIGASRRIRSFVLEPAD